MQSQMQSPKYISNSLPNRLNRYVSLSVTALAFGLLLYGCGENRISQCNKFVTIANKSKEMVAPKDISGFVPLAQNIDQIRTEVQAIAVQDAKLKELQAELLGLYGDVSQALKSQVKATESKDKNAADKAKLELTTAAGKESGIVDRVNALCTK
jgi:hypothetical protein